MQHELHARAAELACAGRSSDAVLERDSGRKRGDGGLGEIALDIGDVRLLHAVARVSQPVGKVAVVREEEDAARVDVEPSDRDDSGLVTDEIDDRGTPFRIAGRRHDAERLV